MTTGTFDIAKYEDHANFRTITARQLSEVDGIVAIMIDGTWMAYNSANTYGDRIVALFRGGIVINKHFYPNLAGKSYKANDKIRVGVVTR